MSIRKQIERLIDQHGIFMPGEGVLVGISGGADSVALTYILHFLRPRLGIDLRLAHLHHSIRGRAADGDLEFVTGLASRLDLPLVSARLDVPRIARERGVSVEMAARHERLAFFGAVLAETGFDKVALAHNADDQAETVLMRLVRGTGSIGLRGIAPLQEVDDMTIAHPMLTVAHEQAVAFLKAHGLRWREDSSNMSDDYMRNRIRHRLMPAIAENLNPRIRDALCRTASIVNAENEFLDEEARRLVDRLADGCGIDLKEYRKSPPALRRRAVLLWLFANGVPSDAIDFESVESVERLSADLRGSKRIDIGSGWSLERVYSSLRLLREGGGAIAAMPRPLRVPGVTICPELGLEVEVELSRGIVSEAERRPGELPSACSISLARLGERELLLRGWRPGDRMRPYGMEGHRKIQDILTDCKVPRSERARIPVIESLGEIVWLPGFRIAHDWALGDPGERSLKLVARHSDA